MARPLLGCAGAALTLVWASCAVAAPSSSARLLQLRGRASIFRSKADLRRRAQRQGGAAPWEPFPKPDLPGGPHTGGLTNIGGGMFAPARPYRFIDDLFPTAPEEVLSNDGAVAQSVVRGTLDESYQLTAPASVFRMDHHTEGLDFSGLLGGPEYDNPAQPLKRFLWKEGDKVSAPMDRVGEKLHKYLDQVRIKVHGKPCPAPKQADVPNSGGTTCIEGPEILPEGTCTPQCSPGFSPTEVELYCRDGGLLPPLFGCREGFLKSVEDCVFESGGDPDKASSCLASGVPAQKLRFDTCVGNMDNFKGHCVATPAKCSGCQQRMGVCLDIAKQAAADGADKKMARLGYDIHCGDLSSGKNSYAKALASAHLVGKVDSAEK